MKRLSVIAPLLLVASGAHAAALQITIVPGGAGAQPIAIVPFGTAPGLNTDLASIVEADLARSGLFAPLPTTDMLEHPNDAAQVDYRNWRMVNVDNLVVGRVISDAATHAMTVRFQLLDVLHAQSIAGFDLPIPDPARPRPVAHQIADIVYEKLTGIKGYFNTQIAYITSSGPNPRDRVYQLIVADADGENPAIVASSHEPLMSPAWAPDARRIAYVGYDHGNSAIYIHDLQSGQARKLLSEKGINGAPAWSPDGKSLAVTLSYGVNPDIYIVDAESGSHRKITDSSAIDTEATWSPDGSEIAFTSDRGGQPQIYTVSSAGGAAQRVTFEGKQNLRPRYAPDGKSLLLVNYDDSRYRIGLLDLRSHALRIVSDGPLDESPSFAPNGALIIYSTTSKQGVELATVTVDGRVRQRLKQVGEVREPAWSPFPR